MTKGHEVVKCMGCAYCSLMENGIWTTAWEWDFQIVARKSIWPQINDSGNLDSEITSAGKIGLTSPLTPFHASVI